ncbi:MAG: response regulator transcription factor [Bacteroidota bacterium]
MKILLVEDEPEMCRIITQSLEKELFLVEIANDFLTASEKINTYEYDIILLDIMLPYGNGLDLLDELKQQDKKSNVIIISAKNDVDDKVKGLNLGADDYLAKPFHIAELTARIKSVFRRNQLEGNRYLEYTNLKLEPEKREVLISDKPLILNRKEFDLLAYFLLNRERLISKTAIAKHIWGDHIDQSDDFEFIYSQVKNLRKKLKESGAEAEIVAVYGMGYKFTSV